MKSDFNPSIICGIFCKPSIYNLLIKHIDQKHGMRVRELRFIDISFPLDSENYNKAINHLKHFSNPILKRVLKVHFPFQNMFLKKMKLKPIDYSKPWDTDTSHKLLYSGLTPLFVDVKYSNRDLYTKEEEANLKKLLKFESENYFPNRSNVCKNQEDVNEGYFEKDKI